MTHFEFLSVAVSIVFALSVGRQVAAIPHVLAAGRRDWLHAGHFGALLLMQIEFWWRMWQFAQVEAWDFLGFTLLVCVVCLYYLSANLLVSADPSAVESWRRHFGSVHKAFHGVIALAWASGAGVSHYLVGFDFVPVPLFVTVALFTLAIFLDRRWYHALLLLWWVLLLIAIAVGLQSGRA